ncbi:fungal Zn binuclear cluster domain-containing protein [Thelonectria olida]|uniref:Fungal Zn binuclear cluster domain-containing protein n=1 Tax=Thelonectria olida TaxID=1576542 RepID=A0A9P8VUQ2_9HYPO|nr:fungal Zn binuclear cluster domain-containing protein [Thelonectria olida]
MPPGSTRLGHRKSRNGCLRCKARHVKCDEKRPCTNCVRFDLPCSLLNNPSSTNTSPDEAAAGDPSASPPLSRGTRRSREPPAGRARLATSPRKAQNEAIVAPTPRVSSPAPTAVPSPQTVHVPSPLSFDGHEADHELSPLWMQSLRLLHHYSTEVYISLSRDPAVAGIWKTVVPETAFTHKFLMHGLLAVSAVHYAHTHPEHRKEYVLVSNHYQTLALQFFASHLDEISRDSFEPYFFLATFIFLLTMWSISHPEDDEKLTPSAVAQSFQLLQGIKLIITFKPMEDWSQDGPLAPLIHSWQPAQTRHSGPFQARMDQLSVLARALAPSLDVINNQSSCLLAIESLRNTHSASHDRNVNLGAREIWIWPITLTRHFIDLISENHPVALIIVAHYAALARPFEHPSWVNQGWTTKVLAAIEAALDEASREWISWPMKSMQECIHVDEMSQMSSPVDGSFDVRSAGLVSESGDRR